MAERCAFFSPEMDCRAENSDRRTLSRSERSTIPKLKWSGGVCAVKLKTFYKGSKLAGEPEHAGFECRNDSGLAERANQKRELAKTNRLYNYLIE